MKKILRIVLIVLLAGFVIAQFFQPEKNYQERSGKHILERENVSGNIEKMLKTSCLDCHSNQTDYLWYHHVAPVSWLINNHIAEGKEHLNLSDWGEQDIFNKLGTLEDMVEEVEKGEMPLKEYVWLHPKAKLDENEIEELRTWNEKLSEELLLNAE